MIFILSPRAKQSPWDIGAKIYGLGFKSGPTRLRAMISSSSVIRVTTENTRRRLNYLAPTIGKQMGYHRHHVIIVTSWHTDSIEAAHHRAREIFVGELISPISPDTTNGFRSFVVYPDGSKEGWPMSDRHDTLRADFTRGLSENGFCEWVEVVFGDTQHGDEAKELLRRSGKDALRVALDAVAQNTDPEGVFRELLEKELGLRAVEVK